MAKWEFWKSKTLGEEEKRNKELIEKSEIVTEDKEKNMRMMKAPDGHIFMTHIEWKPRPSLYGVAVITKEDVTPDDIESAKEMVLERVIESIRDIAKRKPDEFFILHTPSDYKENVSSVGTKFALPTVLDDEEAIGRI